MKKVVKRPIVVSTVSTAVALGAAALFVGRRTKQEKLPLQATEAATGRPTLLSPSIDVYGDDSDLGYC
ncbi:MAG: hypothetical protein AAF847_11645 [Bacteroidota bacterium]